MGDSSVNHNLSRTRNIRMPDGEFTTIRETGRFVEHSPDYNQPYANKHEIPKKVAEYDQRPAIIENNYCFNDKEQRPILPPRPNYH